MKIDVKKLYVIFLLFSLAFSVSTINAQKKPVKKKTVVIQNPPKIHPEDLKIQDLFTIERYAVNYEINADGTFTSTLEFTQRCNMTIGCDSLKRFELPFNSAFQEIEILEAEIINAKGERLPVPAGNRQIKLAPEAEAAPNYTSLKTVQIKFDNVVAGDSTHFKIHLKDKQATLTGYFDSYVLLPVYAFWRDVEVNVNAPPNYPLQSEAIGFEGGKLPDENGRSRWQWRAEVKEPLKVESGAPFFFDISPRLMLSNFQDYKTVGEFYYKNAKEKSAVTPEVKSLADEITKGLSSAQEQAKAIFTWVNKNIRYLNIPLERDVIVPNDVTSVLKNRYGDCKDYAALLQAMLAAKGIESTPMLIRADNTFSLPKVPSFRFFNHVILYVPKLGVYLDATAPNTPYGFLPISLMGKYGVLSGEQTGMIFIPSGTPKDNQIKSTIDLAIQPDGNIKASARASFRGRMEFIFRPIFADKDISSSEIMIEAILKGYNLKGKGKIKNITDGKNVDEPFSIETEYELNNLIVYGPGIFSLPGNLDFFQLGALALLSSLSERKTPVVSGVMQINKTINLAFPSGFKIKEVPQNVNLTNEAGSYISEYKLNGNTLSVTRELIIKQDIYTPQQYPAFRIILNKAIEDDVSYLQYETDDSFQSIVKRTPNPTKKQDSLSALESLISNNNSTLKQASTLKLKDVLALQTQLKNNPDDTKARLLLLAYYRDKKETPTIKKTKLEYRKWLIQNHPEINWMEESGFINWRIDESADYQELRALWLQQTESKKDEKQIRLNAVKFFYYAEPELAAILLEDGLKLFPDDYNFQDELVDIYISIARDDENAESSKKKKLRAIEQGEKMLVTLKKERSNKRDTSRSILLSTLAHFSLDVEEFAKAKSFATEYVLEFGSKDADTAHEGNIILGLIAFKEGDITKAKEHLLIAARSSIREEVTWVTPDFELAEKLFDKGEKDTVVEYLKLCEQIDKDSAKIFQKWQALIKSGKKPNFEEYDY